VFFSNLVFLKLLKASPVFFSKTNFFFKVSSGSKLDDSTTFHKHEKESNMFSDSQTSSKASKMEESSKGVTRKRDAEDSTDSESDNQKRNQPDSRRHILEHKSPDPKDRRKQKSIAGVLSQTKFFLSF
jgi:hypothetical protein